MAGYVKLFGSILQSTVWDHSPSIKVVWITMLALSDSHGVVSSSVPGLAKAAGVERGDCEKALALFLAPDLDSRTKEFHGRRIEAVDGGWRLLNHDKYQHMLSAGDRAQKNAAKQQRWRDRQKTVTNSLPPVTAVTESNPAYLGDGVIADASSPSALKSQISRDPMAATLSTHLFDARAAAAVFSRLRVSRKRGSFKLKTSADFERADAAAATAREDSPADPEAFCARGVANFLEHASGKEADGWPFWGWANDPGKWAAYVPTESQRGPSRVCSAEEHANDPGEF